MHRNDPTWNAECDQQARPLGGSSPLIPFGTEGEAGAAMRLARVLILLPVLGACTDADVYFQQTEPPPPREVAPNRVVGKFCTEDPETIIFPLKIWFVIDDSGSMTTSDTGRNRYTQTKVLAAEKAAPGRVFFGGMVFSTENLTRFTTPRFVDDVNTFNGQVPNSPGNGWTPYLDALEKTRSEFRDDIDENKAMAKRTRYVIIFLSDGMPTRPDPTAPADVLASVDKIMAFNAETGGVTLNTVFLGGGGDQAVVLLQDMATHGKGLFKSFPNGDALSFKDFDFTTIRRTYIQRFFMMTNRSMKPVKEGQEVDSDRDGLSDKEEASIGSNPTLRDTDGDGCNDLLEHEKLWDPLAVTAGECPCDDNTAQLDTDGDGLNDCEEKWIGTRADDPDSDLGKETPIDGDMVPDELDFTMLDATYPNSAKDTDVDGVQDIEELRLHTDVNEIDKDREHWQYSYPIFERENEESRCYNFEVKNVTLGKTLATGGHPALENVIEFYFAQSAQDDPHKDRLYRIARKNIPYAEGGAIVHVNPEDFSQILSAK